MIPFFFILYFKHLGTLNRQLQQPPQFLWIVAAVVEGQSHVTFNRRLQ